MFTPNPSSPEGTRRSHAMEAYSAVLNSRTGLQIIDFDPANQSNIDFVTGRGHRLYTEDFLLSVESWFTPAELEARQIPAARIDGFFRESLNFPDHAAGGAMVWDCLQFLPAPLLQPVLDRLFRILEPDAALLALFLPERAPAAASPSLCRIVDDRTLLLRPRPFRRNVLPLNNRTIERLFQRFRSIRFFLTKDNFRDILVRR